MWQWPILEQKEEQGSLSWVWHLSPVKPEGQMQRKLVVTGEGAEPGRAGSRAWQLPPFWQSWASWQGSGNWHVSPRKPGAHLGRGERKTHIIDAVAFSPTSLPLFPSLVSLHLLHLLPLFSPALSPAFRPPRHTHWQTLRP